MTDLWTPALVEACTDRCAIWGDPPCREVEPGCAPCDDCLRECGIAIVAPIDARAVVRPLL